MGNFLIFLFLLFTHVLSFNVTLKLNEWPMIMSHDFATGYLKKSNILKNEVLRWTKTQDGTIYLQKLHVSVWSYVFFCPEKRFLVN